MRANNRPTALQSRNKGIVPLLEQTTKAHKELAPLPLTEWEPAVEIIEGKNDFLIQIDLSEVKKEKLKVLFKKDTMTISGERNFVLKENNTKEWFITLVFENFKITFWLPDHVDAERVSSDFKQGLLKVRLPKREDASN